MTCKRIIYYILAAFIAGNLILIFMQYNSAKNINNLISGNEKLLSEFKVNSELKELENDVISVESKIRGTVTTNDTSYIEGLEMQIAKVETELDKLQKITDDDSSIKYIDELDYLVRVKLKFNDQILDSFHLAGKAASEKLIATQRGKILTDSIIIITQRIVDIRQNLLADVTRSIDQSGKKAQRFSTILIILVLISGAGLFWYIINIIRDQSQLIHQLNISEKKVKEAAQIKENFLANMSHEIRTPMNAILGFTNLLHRRNLDGESMEYVHTIQKSGENLLTIINDILDLSKIEAGMMRIELAPFSIRGLVNSIEIMFRASADEKQLHFSTYVETSLPDTLEGDATRLTQILVNLIGNALKFTNKGSISVKITNEEISNDTINTGITVADTGIGIEKEKLKTIFERFQQAEESVTRKYGGTGLGLSIVKNLVLLQKGNIYVESDPGIGTTFRLTIPYKIAAEQTSSKPSIQNKVSFEPDTGHIHILAVEDNEINQSLLMQIFKNWQPHFDIASNGKEAIDKLQTKQYDLILMDIQMPEMDGYTATQEIRAKLKLRTPIIAMTAHALAGEREKCLSYGMNEYISKPIREEQLHKLIAQFTPIKKPDLIKKGPIVQANTGSYKHINLQYMKEVSSGNIEYEKTVTEQFIEAVPEELMELEKAWLNKEIANLRQRAHNMKTTVSVMGLNVILQPYLDALEYENLTEDSFQQNFSSLKYKCENALEEANQFYSKL